MNAKDWESENAKGVKEHIQQHGVENLEPYFKKKLEEWREVTVKIAVTGVSGAGKSSFINAIRTLLHHD